MADITDVTTALVNAIATMIYPNGNAQPSMIMLADGTHPDCRVLPSWPLPGQMDADLAAMPPVINISVFPQPGMERDATRYPRVWVDQFQGVPTIAATVAGSTVTLSGTITAGHYVSIVSDNQAASYACLATDTLASVAASLAALLPESLSASATGPAITIQGRTDIVARCAAPGTVMMETSRTNQRFIVTIWAQSNDARQATARVVRPGLDMIDFLQFPDATQGRLIFSNSNEIDRSDKDGVARRDLIYWCEYPTIITAPGYPITIASSQISVADGTQSGATFTQNG